MSDIGIPVDDSIKKAGLQPRFSFTVLLVFRMP